MARLHHIGQPWQYEWIITVYSLPNPWRITARPWRRHTACACLSRAAILSTSTAQPLLLSASAAPSPSSCRRSSRSLDCCWTTFWVMSVPYLNVFWLNSCSPQPLSFDVNDLTDKIKRNGGAPTAPPSAHIPRLGFSSLLSSPTHI